jgi:hypothetical protein
MRRTEMTVAARLGTFFIGAAALFVVACGGGDGEADTTPTPTSTISATVTQGAATATVEMPSTIPAATETPAPTPTTEEPPHAGPIEVDPGISSLGEADIQQVVSPGGVLNLDPINLAQDMGVAPPPCAGLVFYLTWQVRDPYPPEGVNIELYWTQMGATELLGTGPSGQASRGCGEIQVRNNSGFEVAVEIRYAIGEISP